MDATRLEPIMAKTVREVMADRTSIRLLRRDLAVSSTEMQPNGWSEVTFTLTLSPGLIDMVTPETSVPVKVLIVDEFGSFLPKSYDMSSRGQSRTETVQVPIADKSKLHGTSDKGRTINVIVDPFSETTEQSETNNVTSPYCYAIG
jgi:hypothetical protein